MLLDSDRTRLFHMLEAAREAVGYVQGRNRVDLDGNRPLQHCIVRCIEIIGEAASRITPEFKLAHPEIPWRLPVAMRNRLVHVYFDINLDILWQTAEAELPTLIKKIEPLLTGGENT